jgi:hypothetical protein
LKSKFIIVPTCFDIYFYNIILRGKCGDNDEFILISSTCVVTDCTVVINNAMDNNVAQLNIKYITYLNTIFEYVPTLT